nr:protein phosphatase 2C domain-containing protein [Aromatoleum bremense]
MVRDVNEDAFLDRPERGLWVVADGMGGHDAGELASRMIVSAIDGLAPCADLTRFIATARQRLQAVNRQLRAEAAMREVPIIGSTVVVMLGWGPFCAYLWAGDSRIYLYRAGRLMLLSHDHSHAEELRARGLVDSEALASAQNLVTRAVGALDTLELDEGSMPVVDGDIFLLCSDGLTNYASERDIANALAAGDCPQAADTLVELALKGGGRDNITAVVVRAEDSCSADMTMLNPAL